MYEQFMGKYLVKTKRLSPERLQEVLEAKKSEMIKLGFLAVKEGFITEKEAQKINDLQRKEDKYFGEIAIKQGLLTKEQVDVLLSRQKQSDALFKQLLVEKGYMSLVQLDEVVEELIEDYGYTREEIEAIESDNITKISHAFLNINEFDSRYGMFKDLIGMKELVALALRNLIRFVSTDIYIDRPVKISTYRGRYLATQAVVGKAPYHIGLGSSDSPDGLLEVARNFGKEDFVDVNEDALDAVGEFLNCVDGLYVSYPEMEYLKLDMKPQEYFFHMVMDHDNMYMLPIYTNGKRVDLVLCLDEASQNVGK